MGRVVVGFDTEAKCWFNALRRFNITQTPLTGSQVPLSGHPAAGTNKRADVPPNLEVAAGTGLEILGTIDGQLIVLI